MKKILAALLAVCMVLSLAACGSKDPTPPANSGTPSTPSGSSTPAPSGSGDKIEINGVAAQYGQNTNNWWADFQDEFNAAYENINLTVEVISWNDISTVSTPASPTTRPPIS